MKQLQRHKHTQTHKGSTTPRADQSRASKTTHHTRTCSTPSDASCYLRTHRHTITQAHRVACSLTVAGVALAVVAAAAALAGLAGGHLKLPGLVLRRHADDDYGLCGGADLLVQVRVHLAATTTDQINSLSPQEINTW